MALESYEIRAALIWDAVLHLAVYLESTRRHGGRAQVGTFDFNNAHEMAVAMAYFDYEYGDGLAVGDASDAIERIIDLLARATNTVLGIRPINAFPPFQVPENGLNDDIGMNFSQARGTSEHFGALEEVLVIAADRQTIDIVIDQINTDLHSLEDLIKETDDPEEVQEHRDGQRTLQEFMVYFQEIRE